MTPEKNSRKGGVVIVTWPLIFWALNVNRSKFYILSNAAIHSIGQTKIENVKKLFYIYELQRVIDLCVCAYHNPSCHIMFWVWSEYDVSAAPSAVLLWTIARQSVITADTSHCCCSSRQLMMMMMMMMSVTIASNELLRHVHARTPECRRSRPNGHSNFRDFRWQYNKQPASA